MTGLEAIKAHNGWAISFLGVIIVFSGLVLLSFTISQLHRALAIWENRGDVWMNVRRRFFPPPPVPPKPVPAGLAEAARCFRLLTIENQSAPVALPTLLRRAEACGMPKACSRLGGLVQGGILLPDGKGYYYWNQEMYPA